MHRYKEWKILLITRKQQKFSFRPIFSVKGMNSTEKVKNDVMFDRANRSCG